MPPKKTELPLIKKKTCHFISRNLSSTRVFLHPRLVEHQPRIAEPLSCEILGCACQEVDNGLSKQENISLYLCTYIRKHTDMSFDVMQCNVLYVYTTLRMSDIHRYPISNTITEFIAIQRDQIQRDQKPSATSRGSLQLRPQRL